MQKSSEDDVLRRSSTTPHDFANLLIADTIQNAAQKQFYKKLWGSARREITTVEQLKALPVMTKADAVAFLAEFEFEVAPAILSHSSGTSGKITTRCRSAEEIRALASVRQRPTIKTDLGLVPLRLAVDCANHGQTVVAETGEFGLKAVGFDIDVIGHVIQQLDKGYAFPGYTERVKVIHASLGFVKLLTIELLRLGRRPDQLGVELVSTFGEYLSPRWANWLGRQWNATLIDNYGASEIVGGATRCPCCGWYSFAPETWPEVVCPTTYAPIERGIGLLALTELFPFSQLQPMIRFLPGDLVEIGQPDCAGGHRRCFRLLGRHERALTNEAGEILLYPAEAANALDGLSQVQRPSVFHRIQLDGWAADVASPFARFDLDTVEGKRTIVCKLAPKFSIACFPEAADQLCGEARKALLGACTRLADLVNLGLYQLEVRLQQDSSELAAYVAA
jgi:phenylacetate-coenzyme A ligase PaaK-like adenylate-forming protein